MGLSGLVVGLAGMAAGMLCAGPALAQMLSFEGTCSVAAGRMGGQAYASLKCQKAGVAGDYIIRTTEWEREDADAYRKLAALSGRRFTCKFKRSGSSTADDTAYTHYSLSECR